MSPNARDRHAEPPGKRYASVLFSSFFFKQGSINESISRVFFFFHQQKIAFFFLKTQKKSQCLTISHEEEGRIKKKKKSEEGNKRGDTYLP